MACSVDADRAFGPAVHGCRSDFDFTILFQDLILSILPSSAWLLFASIRLVVLIRRPNIAHSGWLSYSKLVSYTSGSSIMAVKLMYCTLVMCVD